MGFQKIPWSLSAAFLNTGPPEGSHDAEANQQDPLYSAGFVPNLQDCQTEEDQLRQAALQGDDPVILTMSSMHGTPINENHGHHIAIDAFPTLFLTGVADIAAERDEKVEMKDWALHLIKLKGGHFARHPQFRYWVLNTMMHQTAQKYQAGICIIIKRTKTLL